MIERYDTDYLAGHYQVDDDNVTILKDGELFSGSAYSLEDYRQLLAYMDANDLSISENYDTVCSQLDIQSYIDYYATQIYINNFDFSESKIRSCGVRTAPMLQTPTPMENGVFP